MIVEFQGKRYEIYFRYKREVDITYCYVDDLISEPRQRVATGVAAKNPIDQFQKKVARKVALTKAIKNFPREMRSVVWEKYLKGHKV